MELVRQYEKAAKVDLRTLLGLEKGDQNEYLVVSVLDLTKSEEAAMANRSSVFCIPSSSSNEANETLNSIALWMRKNRVLDLRSLHGDDRESYNIALYSVPAGEDANASRRNDFYMEDYLLCCAPSDIHNFDSLMVALDRNRLGDDMRKSLVEDFDMPVREFAPHFWLRDLRYCCHPEERQLQQTSYWDLKAA